MRKVNFLAIFFILVTFFASNIWAASFMPKKTAIARFSSTSTNSDISGKASLTEKKDGLEVQVSLKGVPEGDHGFHIHEFGSCADQGKSAGGHFDPNHVNHGLLPRDGHAHAHAGDMGNIYADKNGIAKMEIFLPNVNLSEGKYNVSGRSIILHEKKDSFEQPTGNAGGRIACALIPEV